MTHSTSSVGPGNELAGKVALITGAGRNIGEATAYALAQGGAAVALNTRASRDNLERVAAKIRTDGGQADAFMADIAVEAQVKAMMEAVMKRFGKVDILVLNASVRKETPFLDISFEEWKSILAITLDGSFHLAKACIPSMLKSGGGSIITLGGMHALAGSGRRVHGSVGKHGLVGMTRALAREFAPNNIRVNCVVPGQMDTIRAAGRTERADSAKTIPLGRLGDAREIADTVRFLAGPGASYITGQTLQVNGGVMMF
jgi:3-oxoacyl-[acyl-carrier protein] reductase